MRILLTGASGFIGRHILAICQQKGMRLRLILRPGWQERLTVNPKLCEIFETRDLFTEHPIWLHETLENVDVVIHSAWYAEPGDYLTSAKNTDCLAGTLRLAQGAIDANVRRFVGLGTCIEYQRSHERVKPDSPLDPETPYGVAKVAAYHALENLFDHANMSFLWCRIFQVYGEGEHPGRLIPYIHEMLRTNRSVNLTSGRQIRDFIDVKDAARMIVEGALSDFNGAANICTGKGKSVRKMAMEIAHSYGRKTLLNFDAHPENANDRPYIVGEPSLFHKQHSKP